MLALVLVVIVLGVILETISLHRDPAKVGLEYDISTRNTEPGEAFEVQATITNQSRIPISYLAVNEIYPQVAMLPEDMKFQARYDGTYIKKICRVSGRKRKKLILETRITKRGVYLFKGESIEFGDFLGFREILRRVSLLQEIVVYPGRLACSQLTDALGGFCGDIAARRFLIRDPILTIGSREYTGREPMKDIHWMQSAHRGELMVREYDYTRQLSACVILNADGITVSREDQLDSCCAAARTICETLVGTGVSVFFYTNARLRRTSNEEIWKCEVSAGRTGDLLEGLGRMMCSSRRPLRHVLEYAHRESDFDAAFIVILPATESNDMEAVQRLKRDSGREVLLIHMEELEGEAA
ncbi:MAG: DUF58 domain-containing protein [Clostridiales bacterium]|nr:DUF58 domain-containing protein [Clostridiales bacterium]